MLSTPVHVRAFLVGFNSCFHFSTGVEHNPQCNNACVAEKLQHHFHVLAIVCKKDGMCHVSLVKELSHSTDDKAHVQLELNFKNIVHVFHFISFVRSFIYSNSLKAAKQLWIAATTKTQS